MAGTLHARKARGSVRRMSTALSTLAEYARANPRSQAEHERALTLFPSGLTHDARRQDPFPPWVARAEGAYKWDVDGHRIVDYVMGHGSLVAGHSHPAVVEAVRRQAGLGQHLGASSELRPSGPSASSRLVPCAERVRFTSSGTEATLLALRVARGFTAPRPRAQAGRPLPRLARLRAARRRAAGRPRRAARVAAQSRPHRRRSVRRGRARARARARRRGLRDPRADRRRLGRRAAAPERVASIAAAARAHGALVVFDEVVTGFRWSPGGAQALIGVTPDLTALAKVVAGGLPGAR